MRVLAQEIKQCRNCSLYISRTCAVVGEGPGNTDIMLVGEAPGKNEDAVGRPFVGRSGRVLDDILNSCALSRDQDLFITNIIRCKPPANRIPTETEVRACLPYLYRQLELVRPKIIVTLGATALKWLSGDRSLKISEQRGRWREYEKYLLMPTFHPAALLRNPALKEIALHDFRQVADQQRLLSAK